jgi:hypothetical protein
VEEMSTPTNRTPRKEITEEVAKQLTPVFSDYYPSSNQYLLYQKYEQRFQQENLRIKDFLTNHLYFCRTFSSGIDNPQRSGNPVVQSLFLDAITYLLETELMGTAYIDRVLLLLIGKGIDFHLEPDYDHRYARHATSLEDLQAPSLSLAIKQDFLEANDITLFSKMIDRPLRNKIAHLDYIIENDCFYYKDRKGKKTQVNFSEKIRILTEYYDALTTFFIAQECKIAHRKE